MNVVTIKAPQGAPLQAPDTSARFGSRRAGRSVIVFTRRDDEFCDLVRKGALLGEGFADSLDVAGFRPR